MRRRHAFLTRVRAREAPIEEEQQMRARAAVAEERARIARELHDVISHTVSVMVLQAAAGADVFATHPERSRPDAFRSGHGLRTIAPGESLACAWGSAPPDCTGTARRPLRATAGSRARLLLRG